jgi:outer membrane lipoprotein SlyB
MKKLTRNILAVGALALTMTASEVMARTTVEFGRITGVRTVDTTSGGAQAAGTLIGGALGVASGSGRSSSNRALRGIAGGAAGNRIGAAAGSGTAFEYTVLLRGTRTVTIVTEQAGLRVGDCVSLERGTLNNIRLEADERCATPEAAPSDADISSAYACDAAKRQLLEAETDEDFDRAERRMRLLCN